MGVLGLEVVKVDIPHEQDEWMLLRTALSPYQMEQCAFSKQRDVATAAAPMIAEMGVDAFDEVLKKLEEGLSVEEIERHMNAPKALPAAKGKKASATPKEAPAAMDDRGGYDMDLAGKYLVKDWSYVTPKKRKRVPVNLENIRNLDAVTRKWLHDKAWAAFPDAAPGTVEGNS